MQKIRPMLCADAPKAFDDPNYWFETKYDGARILAKTSGTGKFELMARSGSDKTHIFPELEIKTAYPAIIDGEVVCTTGKFSDVQHRINRENNISWAAQTYPVIYRVFDLIEVEMPKGPLDLRRVMLEKRREYLEKILVPSQNVQLAPIYDSGTKLFQDAISNGWEGVVGKRKDSIYAENSRGWLKVKVWQTDTFMVVGYTEGTGWRQSTFGALVLTDLKGNYVGQVGTGFNDEDIKHITELFSPAPCPLQSVPEKASWVKPFLVTVRYLEFTVDHILRFPSFKGVC